MTSTNITDRPWQRAFQHAYAQLLSDPRKPTQEVERWLAAEAERMANDILPMNPYSLDRIGIDPPNMIYVGTTQRYPHQPHDEVMIDVGWRAGLEFGQQLVVTDTAWSTGERIQFIPVAVISISGVLANLAIGTTTEGITKIREGLPAWATPADAFIMHTQVQKMFIDGRHPHERTRTELRGIIHD